MNYSNLLKINFRKTKRRRNVLIFNNLKNQIQKRLALKIIHFLQIVIQAILGQVFLFFDIFI